jgi:hypothetical protein
VEYILIIKDSTPRKQAEHGEHVAKPEAGQPYKSTMQNLKENTGPGDTLIQNPNEVLHHDEDTRAQLMEQQAESVRYLNELNTVRSDSALDTVYCCHVEIGE